MIRSIRVLATQVILAASLALGFGAPALATDGEVASQPLGTTQTQPPVAFCCDWWGREY